MTNHPLSAVSLYIHLPWCLSKCPYCDFNSHALKTSTLPELDYTQALIDDLQLACADIKDRTVQSIFIGGGTPSLFSAEAIKRLLDACQKYTSLSSNCEVTLETNPGTFEYEKFKDFYTAGINRLSIGVQSLNNDHLRTLGRVHSASEALQAIHTAAELGFDNINIDMMFGLPEQTLTQALIDIQQALTQPIQHLSYYQLTLEPNTIFHRYPPPLPHSDKLWEMQEQALILLEEHGYQRYEVSAYARDGHYCEHNMGYWQYRDYLGIGAGAHTKLTLDGSIVRQQRTRQPDRYMQAVRKHQHIVSRHQVSYDERVFEFMLNNLRLCQGFTLAHFQALTALQWQDIEPIITELTSKNLLLHDQTHIKASALGYRFLDQITAKFLPE